MIYIPRKYYFALLTMIIIAAGSCVEPVSPKLKPQDTNPVLVVEGKITDEAGPFRIKLTRSGNVDMLYSPVPEQNADVNIYNDTGDLYHLNYADGGWYESDDKNLKAVPGALYTLSVTTADGMSYESTPVKMNDVPDIDSLYFDETVRSVLEDGQSSDQTWLNIRVDTHDAGEKVKYWYYEFEETWEVRMLTEDVPVQHAQPGDPPVYTREDINVNDEKIVCWVTKPSRSILIASTFSSPVDELKGFMVQSFGPENEQLHIRYSILVRQSAISREQYEFWKQLKDVNENSGGLYESMPSQVSGNISCCDGENKALGYFAAMSVKEKRLFIDRSEHHVKTKSTYADCSYYDYEPDPRVPRSFFGTDKVSGKNVYCNSDFCSDCRTNGTNIKPGYWQ